MTEETYDHPAMLHHRPPATNLTEIGWQRVLVQIAHGAGELTKPLANSNPSPNGDLDLEGSNILVCEDEVLIAHDIASSVEDAGGDVVGPFATVKEGLDAVYDTLPDAAILDVNLMDGDVTPILKHLVSAGVPVVVNTGTRLPDEVQEPGVPVFLKPTNPEDLIAALREQRAQNDI